MLAIAVYEKALSLIELEKNVLGKFALVGAGFHELSQEEDFFEKIRSVTANKHVTFAISDEKVEILRFEVSHDIVRDVLRSSIISKAEEILHNPLETYVYDFGVYKEEASTHVLFVAAKKNVIVPFEEFANKTSIRSLTIIPHSLSIFQILKSSIALDEIILYADIQKELAELTFFDSKGPLMRLSEPIIIEELFKEIKKATNAFAEKYQKEITTIVLGGIGSPVVERDKLHEETGIATVLTTTFFQDSVEQVSGNTSELKPEMYLISLGTALISFEKELINLARKDEKKSTFYKRFVFVAILLFILIPLLLYAYSWFTKKHIGKGEIIIKKEQPSKVPTSTPTPKLQKSDLLLQVQNGSGEAGLAGKTAEFLNKKGYSQIDTKNADSYSYNGTTLKIKDEKKQYKDLLIGDLKNDYSLNSEVESLDSDSKFDALIIVGK